MNYRLEFLFDCGVESTPELRASGFVNDCYCWGNWQCDRAEGRDKMIRSKTPLHCFFLRDLESISLSVS